MFDMLILY